MKCPLITAGFWSNPDACFRPPIECLKAECAWWSTEYERCPVPLLAAGIDDLFNQLEQINDGIRLVK